MNMRKKIAGAALLAAAATVGGGLTTAAPASAGPISFCDRYPQACYVYVEVDRFKLPYPPECLSCPTDIYRIEDLFTIPALTHDVATFERQVAFGR